MRKTGICKRDNVELTTDKVNRFAGCDVDNRKITCRWLAYLCKVFLVILPLVLLLPFQI